MNTFIQQILNGLQLGSVYALVALGYTMVYGIARLINFAHGDIIMVGCYTTWLSSNWLSKAGMPLWLAIFPTILVCVTVGLLSEKIAYKPLRNSPKISSLITAIGVSFFLQNLAMVIFTSNPKPTKPLIKLNDLQIGSLKINAVSLITILGSLVLMILLQLFVGKSKTGRAMRAVSQDPGAAVLVGVNVNRTIATTFVLGSGLAAFASVMYFSSYGSISPTLGSMLGIKAFIAAVLGGIGLIPGAMLGGLVIGMVESFASISPISQFSDAIVFAILIIILLVKPDGILGKNTREKV